MTLPFITPRQLAKNVGASLRAVLEDDDQTAEVAAFFGVDPADILYSDGEATDYDAHEALVASIKPPKGATSGKVWYSTTADGIPVASINDWGLQRVWTVG